MKNKCIGNKEVHKKRKIPFTIRKIIKNKIRFTR